MITKQQATYDVFGQTGWARFEPRMHLARLPIRAWLRLAERWIERCRTRRALARLDDHLLRDVGISRAEAAREAANPFWR